MFDVESVVLASICNVKRPKVQHSKDSKGVNHSETMKYIFALTDDKHSKIAGPHLTWGLDFNQGQNAALIHKIIFRRDYFVIWMRHISILSHKVMWPRIFLYVWQKYRNASSQNSYCTANIVHCKIWKEWCPQLRTKKKKKKMRRSNRNLIQSYCPNTSSEAAVENLAQLALNKTHFPDCNRGAEEVFSFLLLQGEVDYCFRTNPSQPLAVWETTAESHLVAERRSSHYCARNFNLRLPLLLLTACCSPPPLSPVPGSARNQTLAGSK